MNSSVIAPLCSRDGDTVIWFWIGPHAEYDELLKRL